MGEEQNASKLFPRELPQDEIIPLENDEATQPPKKRKFGRGNAMFLIWLMLLITLSAVFLFLSLQKRDDGSADVPSSVHPAEESMMQSEPPAQTSDDTPSENAVPEESLQGDGSSAESEPQAEEDSHGWIINSMGYTYLYHGIGVEQFNYSPATLDRYLSGIRALAGMVPEGTSVYCMVTNSISAVTIPGV